MAFPEYRLTRLKKLFWIRESNDKIQWHAKAQNNPPSILSLEEEIYELRNKLEQLVQDQTMLSSPEVVRLSKQLDEKINEYNRRTEDC